MGCFCNECINIKHINTRSIKSGGIEIDTVPRQSGRQPPLGLVGGSKDQKQDCDFELLYSVFQRLTCHKRRHIGSCNLNFGPGLGVASGAGSAVVHLKGAKANQLNRIAIL